MKLKCDENNEAGGEKCLFLKNYFRYADITDHFEIRKDGRI